MNGTFHYASVNETTGKHGSNDSIAKRFKVSKAAMTTWRKNAAKILAVEILCSFPRYLDPN